MMHTSEISELEARKRLADLAISDVVEDATKLLELHRRLHEMSEGSEAYEDVQVELEVQVTAIRIHAESAEEAIEAYTDALPEDDE